MLALSVTCCFGYCSDTGCGAKDISPAGFGINVRMARGPFMEYHLVRVPAVERDDAHADGVDAAVCTEDFRGCCKHAACH